MDEDFIRDGSKFCWDKDKNAKNQAKHGLNFPLASYVFDDDRAIHDDDPYPFEQRFRTIGMIDTIYVFVVWQIEDDFFAPDHPFTRIISAREAEASERRIYEEGHF